MPLTNRWNQFIYRLWAPFYDRVFTRLFAAGRRQAIAAMAPQPGERLLLAGIGTGADLPLLPAGVQVVGVDLSPAMLARARVRRDQANAYLLLIQADAQALPLRDGVCDAALLSLIVSVVPNGAACLRETVRALRPSARIVIFDKFLPDDAWLGIIRRLLNAGARWFGTDINRRLGDLLANSGCIVEQNLPSLMHGVYRVVVVKPVLHDLHRDHVAALSNPEPGRNAGPGARLPRCRGRHPPWQRCRRSVCRARLRDPRRVAPAGGSRIDAL